MYLVLLEEFEFADRGVPAWYICSVVWFVPTAITPPVAKRQSGSDLCQLHPQGEAKKKQYVIDT